MNRLALIPLSCLMFLGGCAFLDKAVGTHDEAGPVENFVDGVSGLATGTPLAPILAGLSILINGYQAVRGKKYREGLEGVVVGVDRALDAGAKSTAGKAELYESIRLALKEVAGDAAAVERLIAAFKAKERA